MAPIALFLVFLGGWAFLAFVALLMVLLTREWSRLIGARFGPEGGRLAGWGVLLTVLAGLLLLALAGLNGAALALLTGALLLALLARHAGVPIGWGCIGVAYLGLPAVALVWLRAVPEYGLALLVWLLVIVWSTDTAAYFAGRGIGGPRLAPAISPSKTWAGLLGGMGGAALAGGLAAWALGIGKILQLAGLGMALAVVAQLGDLFESAAKRAAGVKDSGGLIPGHGGLLDRLDGLLFAAPALALVIAATIGLQASTWP